MTTRRIALPAAVPALVLVSPAAGGPTLLRASIGPFRTIQLQDAQGRP